MFPSRLCRCSTAWMPCSARNLRKATACSLSGVSQSTRISKLKSCGRSFCFVRVDSHGPLVVVFVCSRLHLRELLNDAHVFVSPFCVVCLLDRVIALRAGPGEPGPVSEGTIGTGHAPALFPPIVSNPHTPTLGGRILPEQTRPCMRWTVCHGPRCGQTGASMRLPTGRQGAQCGRAYRFSSLPPFSDLGGHHCPPGPRFSGSGGHHLPELRTS
jgi:hypothetical protein